MNFIAPVFPIFLIAVFTLYWGVFKRREERLLFLLAASALFYGWWDWRFLGLIAFVILVAHLTALRAGDAGKSDGGRNRWTALGVGISLATLGVFKYFGFFVESGAAALSAMGFDANTGTLRIILPVGISFYIFQAISYVVDARRGHLPAETRLHRTALYIGFFPQLVAGPIVRAASFFPQMDRDKRLTRALFQSGLRAILLGLVYKAGIADNLAPLVDAVYGDPSSDGAAMAGYSNASVIGATLAFAGQIYFDFAGYSLIAIGVARLFGFYIPRNFDFPYAATNIADFWRRWHMSLSFWLRDYLYIPLGGNRGGEGATHRNLFLTMLLGGLWHGAAWTFVAWGALQGAALSAHRAVMRKLRPGAPAHAPATGLVGAAVGLVLTQGFVLLAWVPFRATDFGQAMEAWAAFAGVRAGGIETLPLTVWAVPVLIALDAILGKSKLRRTARAAFARQPAVYWGGTGALVGLLLALYPMNPAPFVYFQF